MCLWQKSLHHATPRKLTGCIVEVIPKLLESYTKYLYSSSYIFITVSLYSVIIYTYFMNEGTQPDW